MSVYPLKMPVTPYTPALIRQIIGAYDSAVIRSYCTVRFHILRQRFLEEIGQYLPDDGQVLDIGCGFGLFSLYYAASHPHLRFHGVDFNAKRIDAASTAAARLGLTNVLYEVGDARSFLCQERYTGAYLMDIIHHVSPDKVTGLLAEISSGLAPGSRLIVKDCDAKPAYKRHFTWALDKLMDPTAAVNYWAASDLAAALTAEGFSVYRHAMVDYLPYPHMLYVCEKRIL